MLRLMMSVTIQRKITTTKAIIFLGIDYRLKQLVLSRMSEFLIIVSWNFRITLPLLASYL